MRRRLRLAAPFIVLALTVAACGGSTVAVQEVPGGAVDLTTPGNGAALNPAATATATIAAGGTPTPTATTTGASSTSTGTTQQSGATTTTGSTDGGTQAPSTSTTGAATATPAPGSPGQQFEDFCAQNPGAC